MKRVYILTIVSILFIVIFFSLIFPIKFSYNDESNNDDTTSTNNKPQSSILKTESNKNTKEMPQNYIYSGTVPEKSIKMFSNTSNDFRTFTVYEFDKNIVYSQTNDNSYLEIYNPQYESLDYYKFYGDLELLEGIQNGTARLGDDAMKTTLQTEFNGNAKTFEVYEQTMANKILRKYFFNYGGVEYLISVEIDKSKVEEYTELTNKLLATMIPHTMITESAKKFLESLK